MEPVLSQEFLKSILHYCPQTGLFVWKVRSDVSKSWNTRFSGKTAGYRWKASRRVTYICIRILDYPFLGHRVAWFYMTGEWPPLVDHWDTDGTNNAWGNLRLASKAQNAINADLSISNKSGVLGVCETRFGTYRAFMRINGKSVHLGSFKTKEAAAVARKNAEKDVYGNFSRQP